MSWDLGNTILNHVSDEVGDVVFWSDDEL